MWRIVVLVGLISIPISVLVLKASSDEGRFFIESVFLGFYWPSWLLFIFVFGGPHGSPGWGWEAGAILGVFSQNLVITLAVKHIYLWWINHFHAK